jgi:hypothetical protein
MQDAPCDSTGLFYRQASAASYHTRMRAEAPGATLVVEHLAQLCSNYHTLKALVHSGMQATQGPSCRRCCQPCISCWGLSKRIEQQDITNHCYSSVCVLFVFQNGLVKCECRRCHPVLTALSPPQPPAQHSGPQITAGTCHNPLWSTLSV